jgi:hypothetical protein
MVVIKHSGKFGGRPITRKPAEPGKRVQLNMAVPQPLKAKLEKAAKASGWSVSAEGARRLERSFEPRVAQVRVSHSISEFEPLFDQMNKQIAALTDQVADLTAKLAEKETTK